MSPQTPAIRSRVGRYIGILCCVLGRTSPALAIQTHGPPRGTLCPPNPPSGLLLSRYPQTSYGKAVYALFTTKENGTGTGPGLNVSRDIVHKHRGSLQVKNRPKGGAVFTIRLLGGHPSTSTDGGQGT
ncbi:MAG: ATP-binding protein [Desulfobacteraceae bacterium]